MRYTYKCENGEYAARELTLLADNIYGGKAIDRLAAYENIYCDIMEQQEIISRKLAELRTQNKEKSVQFKELLIKKLNNANILSTFKAYGIK